MSPIRVAQIMGKMVGGGVESVVMNYYRHLDHNRVQFDFIVDADSSFIPTDEIVSLGGRIFIVPPYQKQPDYFLALEELFSQYEWRIVHSHLNALSVIPLRAAWRVGIPVRIAHSHSTWGKGETKKNVLKAILRPLANRYPTHRMACTKHAGEWLFGKKASFKVLYNAIEIEDFAFDESTRDRLRNELGVRRNEYLIGCIGRLTAQKNQTFLINAFSELYSRVHNAHLALVGEGPDRGKLTEQIKSLNLEKNVHLLGFRDDVSELYSSFDAFCLPSTYEGLGMVAIEAQVNSLPTLLSLEVPADVDITDSAIHLPLDEKKWANTLFSIFLNGPERNHKNTDSDFSKYDIRMQAPRLMEYYEAIYANVRR